MTDIRNARADAAFLKLAAKVHAHAAALERMGEEDMGLLTEILAGKFHKATALLCALDRTLAQVTTEMANTARTS